MHADQLTETIRRLVEAGEVPGAVVGVLHGDDVSTAAVGTTEPGGGVAMPVDALARISSNTKPMVAAATLLLAQEGVLSLARGAWPSHGTSGRRAADRSG